MSCSDHNNNMQGASQRAFNAPVYSMDDAAMQSGIPDSGMKDSGAQDAQPSFIATAFTALENSAHLQSMSSPNDSSFEGWMALLDHRLDTLGIQKPWVGNKRVKPPTTRSSDSDQVQLDEAEVEHLFSYAEAGSKEVAGDEHCHELVAALTAAFESDSASETASASQQSPPPTPKPVIPTPEQQQRRREVIQALHKYHSATNPFYRDDMTLAWAATNIATSFREASDSLSHWHMTQDPSIIVASSLKKSSDLNRIFATIQWTLEFLAVGREGFCLLQLPDDFFLEMCCRWLTALSSG